MDGTDPIDPGAPPARGIVVRPDGEGFYARVYPRPPLGVFRLAGVVVGLLAIGWVAALMAGDDATLRAEVVAATVLFGLLISGVSYGYGFVPVEITADDDTLYWGGERFPMTDVGSCRPEGTRLVLRARDGRELGAISHVPVEAAVWLGRAVEASLRP